MTIDLQNPTSIFLVCIFTAIWSAGWLWGKHDDSQSFPMLLFFLAHIILTIVWAVSLLVSLYEILRTTLAIPS